MKIKQLLSIVLTVTFLSISSYGQKLEVLQKYDWSEKPNHFEYDSTDEPIIGTLEKVIVSFEYNDAGNLLEYYLLHKAYILNSDEKIEEYNKLYLPYTSSSSVLIDMKARVIKKNGDIIVLDDSKILTSKDEENDREYKYYAFEGIEKGSVIEYFYILKKAPGYSGKRVTLQNSYPKFKVNLDVYAPSNLVFKFKSYNGLSDVVLDTNYDEGLRWSVEIDKIEKLEYEDLSSYNANKQYLIYKLYYNSATKTYDVSSYGAIVKNAYSIFYYEKSKSEIKAVKKIIKDNNFLIARNEHSKIRAIEDYIKNTYHVVNASASELEDIIKVMANKVASHRGITKLYIAIFEQLEIKHQFGLTSDRFKLKFDKKFEASNFLTDYIFYFPKLKLYMSPIELDSRLGFPPYQLTNNYGMFMKNIEVNGLKTAVAKIRFIKPVKYKESFDEILVDVSLNSDDVYNSKITCDKSTAGYYAANIQPYMNLFKEDNKKEIIDEYIKFIDPDIIIKSKKVYYDDSKYFGIEPFKVVSEFNIDPFIENAGENILLKVGKLIGPQMEMYQEKKRVMPIESRYKKNYHRVITINLGNYKIENLDKINIHNEYVKDEEILMLFKSSYTLENNVLTIVVDEFYDIINIEVENYETYRKIINSAADFNKVSLLMKK